MQNVLGSVFLFLYQLFGIFLMGNQFTKRYVNWAKSHLCKEKIFLLHRVMLQLNIIIITI